MEECGSCVLQCITLPCIHRGPQADKFMLAEKSAFDTNSPCRYRLCYPCNLSAYVVTKYTIK